MRAERNLVMKGDEVVASVHASRHDGGEAERLARLFAAAPETLEALKDVFALIEEGFLVRDVSRDADPLWALDSIRFITRLKDAYAAIAKAEAKP